MGLVFSSLFWVQKTGPIIIKKNPWLSTSNLIYIIEAQISSFRRTSKTRRKTGTAVAANHRLHAKNGRKKESFYLSQYRPVSGRFALPSYGSDKFVYNLPNPYIYIYIFFFAQKEWNRKTSSQPRSSRVNQ